MSITKMNAEVENITNQPNLIVGKASDLKKMFDKSGKDIKAYINTILIPELEAMMQTKMNTGSKTSELINNGDGESPFATLKDVLTEIASLVDSSPDALNTLNELANALGNDPDFATTVLNLISEKVDKESGKKLSSNDFTDFEKNKLSELPDAKELFEVLNSKISLIYTDAQDENFSYDNFKSNGIYFIVVNDGDVSLVHTLKVWWDFETLYQELDNSQRRMFEYNEWTGWETFNVDFTPDEKKEVAKIKDIEEEVNNLIPEIDSLWNFVNTHESDISYLMEQTGSIDSALDNIIEIQNSLIGGDL